MNLFKKWLSDFFTSETKPSDLLLFTAYEQARSDATTTWISVEDEMPQGGVRVLVYSKHNWIAIGSTIKGCKVKRFYDGDGCSWNTITHWMPLPAHPNKVKP